MRVAAIQTPAAPLDAWPETLPQLERYVADAADAGAQLAVLPEGAWPAYVIGSVEAYRSAVASGMPVGDKFLAEVQRWAREHRLAICIGHIAPTNGGLHNAATVVDASGAVCGTHAKCFLWDFDHDWFVAGDALRPIDTPLGKVGVMICADARLPEIAATLVQRGAQLLVQPTGWVNAGTPEQPYNPQPDFLARARALEFGVPVISASKWGIESGELFVGQSLICTADGDVLAQADMEETRILVADVPIAAPPPSQTTDAERAMLLGDLPPTAPRPDVPNVSVHVLPPAAGTGLIGQPRLALSLVPKNLTPLVQQLVIEGPSKLTRDFVGAQVAAVSAQEARRFGPLRGFALGGAHLGVVFGEGTPLAVLQARALENRIYLVQVGQRVARVLDPRGQVTCEAPLLHAENPPLDGRPLCPPLPLRATVDKCVTNRTDVLADRRPATYEF